MNVNASRYECQSDINIQHYNGDGSQRILWFSCIEKKSVASKNISSNIQLELPKLFDNMLRFTIAPENTDPSADFFDAQFVHKGSLHNPHLPDLVLVFKQAWRVVWKIASIASK